MADNFNIDSLGERYANYYTDFAFFKAVDLSKFTSAERRGYEESLKVMRANFSIMETNYNAGVRDGVKEVAI